MQWTKRHSQNAVAAKARRRMQPQPIEVGCAAKIIRPRPAKPDFILRIEDRFGARVQISIHRYHGRVFIPGGLSVRQLCRGLEQLLTKSA